MRSHLVFALLVAGCSFNEPTKPDPKTSTSAPKGVLNGEAFNAKTLVPPLSGGTLTISKVVANRAYASNADLGTVDVVTLGTNGTGSLLRSFDVGGEGVEPGRIAEDPQGLVYAVLRNRGQIATIDVAKDSMTLRKVCPAPRGIASNGSAMIVACQGGEVMSLPYGSGDATVVAQLETDLRDVVPTSSGMFVSRFRSAELLQVANGAMMAKSTPWVAEDHVPDPIKAGVTIEYARYTPEVAWRTIEASDGSVYSVHLYATTRTVPTVRNPDRPVPYYGAAPVSTTANRCFSGGGVVLTAVTRYENGKPTGTVAFPFMTTAIDIAVSPNGKSIALAVPATSSLLDNPVGGGSTHAVYTVSTANFNSEVPTCFDNVTSGRLVVGRGEPVALAFKSDNAILVQTREPAQLLTINPQQQSSTTSGITLSDSVHDSGFTMFHESTGSNIACMSCHPEGGEDGHTWHFDLGFRRTQSIRGGILATAPFHWGGDEANMTALSHDVFSERMGGGTMTDEQTVVLGNWVNRIPAIPSRSTLDMAAVTRGQAIFTKADCQSCHSGDRFTNNENKDIGTGQKFQVPSLLGVSARAPYMHDGCAPDLMSRFTNTKCGGSDHGKISGLSASELSDLVSYVESL